MCVRAAAAAAAVSMAIGAMGQSESRAVFVGHDSKTTAGAASFRVNADESLTPTGFWFGVGGTGRSETWQQGTTCSS